MVDNTKLTKQAIDELLNGVNVYKKYDPNSKACKREVNSLIKPNTRFLGRTLISMLSHNKRETERTRKLCQRKLRHLDRKHRAREYQRVSAVQTFDQHKPTYITHSYDSSTSTENEEQREKHKRNRKKRKRLKVKSISISSESSDYKSHNEDENKNKLYENKSSQFFQQNNGGVEMHQMEQWDNSWYNNFTTNAFTALAYKNHVNRLLWQRHQLQNRHQQYVQQQKILNSINIVSSDTSNSIPSDLTLSSASDISLDINLSSLSDNNKDGTKVENNILTFEVLSSDNDNNDEIMSQCDRQKNKDSLKFDNLTTIVSTDSELDQAGITSKSLVSNKESIVDLTKD